MKEINTDYLDFLLFFIIILFIMIREFFIFGYVTNQPENGTFLERINNIDNATNLPLLESILLNAIKTVNLTNKDCVDGYCKCYDYANWYNKTLTEKYPELDIRWLRHVDLCNNLTMCDNYHTFIIVSGYGQECILDQHLYTCILLMENIAYDKSKNETGVSTHCKGIGGNTSNEPMGCY
jgi:hypothetical protein